MDDRAVGVLEKYDLKVIRTWKGRGTILFESDKGIRVLQEYTGGKERILFQDSLIRHLKEKGICQVDGFERNKDGELYTEDVDKKTYTVKEYFEGKDCNIYEEEDCEKAASFLAVLHKAMQMNTDKECVLLPVNELSREYEKHNTELKRIRKAIRNKGHKTDFEIFLLQNFDYYYERAQEASRLVSAENWKPLYEEVRKKGTISHGDYQYHNIRFSEKQIYVMNFEKYALDVQIRDLYLFMRKVLEKNNWDSSRSEKILAAYEKVKPLNEVERKQLYYRFFYPEKFWKIMNGYYNRGKSWIPMRHIDKLNKLILQENHREEFLRNFQ